MKNIRITFSESDLQDLLDGNTFDWTINNVNVHLCRCDYICEKCGEEIESGSEHEGTDEKLYCIDCFLKI